MKHIFTIGDLEFEESKDIELNDLHSFEEFEKYNMMVNLLNNIMDMYPNIGRDIEYMTLVNSNNVDANWYFKICNYECHLNIEVDKDRPYFTRLHLKLDRIGIIAYKKGSPLNH